MAGWPVFEDRTQQHEDMGSSLLGAAGQGTGCPGNDRTIFHLAWQGLKYAVPVSIIL